LIFFVFLFEGVGRVEGGEDRGREGGRGKKRFR